MKTILLHQNESGTYNVYMTDIHVSISEDEFPYNPIYTDVSTDVIEAILHNLSVFIDQSQARSNRAYGVERCC